MIQKLHELYQYREMIASLVRKDLKGRYKGSVLGFLWTFTKHVGLDIELTVPVHFLHTDFPTAHIDLSVGPFFQF